jgi:signal transduction histidine kinase/DNA-binding response OmpR family regulator
MEMSILTGARLLSFFDRRQERIDLSQFHELPIQVLAVCTCLAGVGLALFGSDLGLNPFQITVVALGLMIPGLASIVLTIGHIRLSVWLIYLSWLGCALGFALNSFDHPLLALLSFPILYAMVFIHPLAGFLTCAAAGALTALFSQAVDPVDGWIYFATMLVLLLVLWLGLRSHQEMIEWLWNHSEESDEELEQAREQRGQLNQAVYDLAEANVQMMRLNQLLNSARYQAEEAERVKAEFVANVSHELRTPLNMILGYCELIMDFPSVYGGKLPARLLADIAAVQRNSQHLVNLINDVLDISQIEARRMALHKDWVSLQNVANEVAIAVQPLIESRSLYLNMEIPEDLPPLYIDQTRIRQVLLNLVSNAARVTESGGITIKIQPAEEQLKVIVSDTGPGIAPEDLSKLFQPFRQLDGSLKRKQGGSGLGLNISRNFVELHGGSIGVESQVGRGSDFWFILPVREKPEPGSSYGRWLSSEYDQRRHPVYANPVKVLPRIVILEPSSLVYEQAGRAISDVDLEQVATPEAALEVLNASPCQAVIVRGETEEQTGAWARQVQASRFVSPVVTLTLAREDYRQQLEVAHYLIKPVDHRLLLDAIRSIQKPITSILLVDDDIETLQLFTRLLTTGESPYRVLQALNGEEALKLLKSRPVDLVILDLYMPRMDGFAFLKAKARLTKKRDVPVIILSAEDPAIHPLAVASMTVMRQNGLSIEELCRYVLKLGEF